MSGILLQHVIKLALGAVATFLAILLWSRTRDAAWMSLVAGVVISYVGMVFEMLRDIGVISVSNIIHVLGVPLPSLLLSTVPLLFFIFAFALMLGRNRK